MDYTPNKNSNLIIFRKRLSGILILLVVTLLASGVEASLSAWVTTQDTLYYKGESAEIRFGIVNTDVETQVRYLEYYASPLYQEKAVSSEIVIRAGDTEVFSRSIEITDDFPPGIYEYVVILQDMDTRQFIDSASKEFTIIGTLKSLSDIYYLVCANIACDNAGIVFELVDNPIYIKAFDFENADMTGLVVYPDGNSAATVFENGISEIKVDQVGKYQVYVTAWKFGHRDYDALREFTVVEQKPEIVNLLPAPVNACTNGFQDSNEEGIDCGPNCPNSCNTLQSIIADYLQDRNTLSSTFIKVKSLFGI